MALDEDPLRDGLQSIELATPAAEPAEVGARLRIELQAATAILVIAPRAVCEYQQSPRALQLGEYRLDELRVR